jgi:hypothetical protein
MKSKKSRKTAALCLPIFDARSALSTLNVLDAIITAIWAVHGDMIVELQTNLAKVPVPLPKPKEPVEDIF